MTAHPYSGLGNTRTGQNKQVNRAFSGMAEELKRKRVETTDCDEPKTLDGWRWLVESLRQKLDEAQATNDDLRAQLNSDAPIVTSKAEYWDSQRVARESGVAVCTICRNANKLGGMKLAGDWLFPVGTTYGRLRKAK